MTSETDTERWRTRDSWEALAGYSRAARASGLIAVSGTTANGPDGAALFPGDTYRQTRQALESALQAVIGLGGTATSVLRTRVMLVPDADWREASRAHADVFGDVAPANTMVYVHALIGEGFLVEVEIDAVSNDRV